MSFVSKLFALGAALAVARADYVTSTDYSDAGCTVATGTSYPYIGCQAVSGGSSINSAQAVCSSSTLNYYSSAACSGTPLQTSPLASTFGGGSQGTCTSRGGGTWTKWTCSTGVFAVSSLPVGLPVQAFFADAGCKTITGAYSPGSTCTPNQPQPGMSTSQTCSATQIIVNAYSASTTCSGASTQIAANSIPGCTAASGGSSGYQQTLCNAAPAKSGAVGVAAGLMAAAAAAAAVVALAA